MTTAVPTLSAAGWVRSPEEKADALLAHYFESDKLQTYLYPGQVTNLQYTFQQHGHDIPSLVSAMRMELEIYLGRHYDAVLVDITPEDMMEPGEEGKVKLRLYCRVTESGKEYSFGQLIEGTNSKILKITKLNNYGTEISP